MTHAFDVIIGQLEAIGPCTPEIVPATHGYSYRWVNAKYECSDWEECNAIAAKLRALKLPPSVKVGITMWQHETGYEFVVNFSWMSRYK